MRIASLMSCVLALGCAPLAAPPDDGTPGNPPETPDAGTAVADDGTLSVAPGSLAFGTLVTLDTDARDVVVTNDSAVLVELDVSLAAGAPHFVVPEAHLSLAPGEAARVYVTFQPQFAGEFAGTLRIASATTTVDVPVSGAGLVAAPCVPGQLSLSPDQVQFGNVDPTRRIVLPVTITNTADTCRLPAPTWIENTNEVFRIDRPFPDGTVLHAGGTQSLQVSAAATTTGTLIGRLLLAGEAETGAVFEIRLR